MTPGNQSYTIAQKIKVKLANGWYSPYIISILIGKDKIYAIKNNCLFKKQ